ncbi:1,4-beta-D-xylan xylanohydrolase [Saitozyma sp. JCM 24511]|nr:1,4-beta-D-xylan xylanohydrolase [Saitozyma sp. JCM 24511]
MVQLQLHLLAALLPALALAIPSPVAPRSPATNLAGAASKDNKRYFGDAYQSFYLADPRYGPILDSQFSAYTPENEMKWEVIEPTRGVFNWTGSDLIVAHAKKTHSIVRGHNFCWDSQTTKRNARSTDNPSPSYVTSITDPTELTQVLEEHINAVLGRYGNDLYAFDVINEPLNDNGTIKSSVWSNVLGENYIETATGRNGARHMAHVCLDSLSQLNIAHKAAPNVKLYINDYNIEGVNSKSQALATIAKNLLQKGVPLHGIGFESHFIGGELPGDISQSMKQFTDLGLDVAITELDIRVPVDSSGVANATVQKMQADNYATVVQACLDNGNCPGVTVWGFDDGHSWIPGVFKGQGDANLYDFNYQPKPAYYSTLAALQQGK